MIARLHGMKLSLFKEAYFMFLINRYFIVKEGEVPDRVS